VPRERHIYLLCSLSIDVRLPPDVLPLFAAHLLLLPAGVAARDVQGVPPHAALPDAVGLEPPPVPADVMSADGLETLRRLLRRAVAGHADWPGRLGALHRLCTRAVAVAGGTLMGVHHTPPWVVDAAVAACLDGHAQVTIGRGEGGVANHAQ
jgi:hypothetical protein